MLKEERLGLKKNDGYVERREMGLKKKRLNLSTLGFPIYMDISWSGYQERVTRYVEKREIRSEEEEWWVCWKKINGFEEEDTKMVMIVFSNLYGHFMVRISRMCDKVCWKKRD